VRNGGDNRLVTSINPNTGITAVSTAKSVYILTNDAIVSNSLSHDNEECRTAIDWLDTNTVAFEANSPDSTNHHIKLWDVRTAKGVVSRFKVRNRITGLLNPSNAPNTSRDGRQLLASTNHRINLYDTRISHTVHKDDVALLSFPHIHQGPELDFTTDGRNLIAAVDRDNVVQIFSMRSGRRVDSLSAPRPKSYMPQHHMVKKLQWYDDPKVGSALQACVGNDVVRWSWGGGMDGEDG
jgi:WD40 repeat protein